jgi:hypothetical protein
MLGPIGACFGLVPVLLGPIASRHAFSALTTEELNTLLALAEHCGSLVRECQIRKRKEHR